MLVFCPQYLLHAAIKFVLLLMFCTEATDDVSFVQIITAVCVGAECVRKK